MIFLEQLTIVIIHVIIVLIIVLTMAKHKQSHTGEKQFKCKTCVF